MWVKDAPLGMEFAEIELGPDRLTATGVAIGTAPLDYGLDCELETGADFVTSKLCVQTEMDSSSTTRASHGVL
jgi:hypothetical protein